MSDKNHNKKDTHLDEFGWTNDGKKSLQHLLRLLANGQNDSAPPNRIDAILNQISASNHGHPTPPSLSLQQTAPFLPNFQYVHPAPPSLSLAQTAPQNYQSFAQWNRVNRSKKRKSEFKYNGTVAKKIKLNPISKKKKKMKTTIVHQIMVPMASASSISQFGVERLSAIGCTVRYPVAVQSTKLFNAIRLNGQVWLDDNSPFAQDFGNVFDVCVLGSGNANVKTLTKGCSLSVQDKQFGVLSSLTFQESGSFWRKNVTKGEIQVFLRPVKDDFVLNRELYIDDIEAEEMNLFHFNTRSKDNSKRDDGSKREADEETDDEVEGKTKEVECDVDPDPDVCVICKRIGSELKQRHVVSMSCCGNKICFKCLVEWKGKKASSTSLCPYRCGAIEFDQNGYDQSDYDQNDDGLEHVLDLTGESMDGGNDGDGDDEQDVQEEL